VRVGRGETSRSRRADSALVVLVVELVLLRRRKRDWVFCVNDERVADVGAGCGRNFGGEGVGVVTFPAVAGRGIFWAGSGDRERAWRFLGVGRMLEDAE
jgi:hypothetical protein